MSAPYIKHIPNLTYAFAVFSALVCCILFIRLGHSSAYANATPPVTLANSDAGAFYPVTCGSVTNIGTCNTSLKLDAEANQPNYVWSTGAITQSITVTTSGTYWWETIDFTNNKVTNGDFSAGNVQVNSAYTYIAPTGSTGSSGALQAEGYYTIATDPRLTHKDFSSFGDHTSGSGDMMVVNGAKTANVTIWKQEINIIPNTDYIFSVWFTSVHPTNPGKLNFSINGDALGAPILLSSAITSTKADWKNFTVRWKSGNNPNNTTATIGIVNQNTATNGNDFALDDIVFAPVCRNTYNVTFYPSPNKPAITPN